ncbi:unnamed protein product [Symbiodinium sp. CCMP2592]|nr:unnamed protein product [Symbiodinium sp. CCMP2592]
MGCQSTKVVPAEPELKAVAPTAETPQSQSAQDSSPERTELTEGAQEAAKATAPAWALDLGLDGHCDQVRDYFRKRSQETPPWLEEDAAIWQQLEHGRAYDEERRQAVDSYAHSVTLEKDGKPTAVLRAAPGEDVELHAKGWIQNKEGDTSLHQLLLVLDTTIIAEVYDSIPGGGDTFDTAFSFKAPEEPGVYMIWRFNELQQSMEEAKASLTAKGSVVDASQYPAFFTGTLVVASSGSADVPENEADAAADAGKEATNTDKEEAANASKATVPAWAAELGIDGDHCGYVRDYFRKRSQETPPWLEEDAAIWQQLEHGRAYDEERRQAVDSYAHSVTLEKDGKPTAVLRAAPGEDVELHAKGWIQNKEGDTSLHQLLLVLDTTIIAEVYDSIPGGGDTFDTAFSFKAPEEPGVYMIWRFNELQQSMEEAKAIFEQGQSIDAKKAKTLLRLRRGRPAGF